MHLWIDLNTLKFVKSNLDEKGELQIDNCVKLKLLPDNNVVIILTDGYRVWINGKRVLDGCITEAKIGEMKANGFHLLKEYRHGRDKIVEIGYYSRYNENKQKEEVNNNNKKKQYTSIKKINF